MTSERASMQQGLEAVFARLYGGLEGARFERRSDLVVAVNPSFPIPQCNGPWVVADTEAAAAALAGAIAEVEAAGAWPWVQTRAGQHRAQRAARELGLTHVEHIPGMAMRPGELVEPRPALEIGHVSPGETAAANAILAASFETPTELFDRFGERLARIAEASWYVGRVDGEIVSTAVGFTVDGATGVFNVATAPERRGRGYGAALTARAVRDGFEAGSRLAFLQASDAGHGLYRRLGFRDVEEYLLLTRPL